MKSATADTNIYISGYRFGGAPEHFLDQAAAGAFQLHISEAILQETLRVLREKFQWNQDALREAEKDIRGYTHPVTPTEMLDIIKADPPDNRILECAAAANSDCIVTGDTHHLLPLRSFRGKPILKVADFLRQLEPQAGRQRF